MTHKHNWHFLDQRPYFEAKEWCHICNKTRTPGVMIMREHSQTTEQLETKIQAAIRLTKILTGLTFKIRP